MTLSLVMNVRFPTEKAHGWQIAKMAEALLANGTDVEVVVPDRYSAQGQDPWAYYGVRGPRLVRLPVLDLFPLAWVPRPFAFAAFELSFLWAVRRWAKAAGGARVVLTRDQFLAAWFRRPGWKVAFEMHDVPEDFFTTHRRLGRKAAGFVVTNRWKRDRIADAWGGGAAARTAVLPNGVDLSAYAGLPSRDEACARLGWDPAALRVVYTGHLYRWKGVHTLAAASASLPEGWETVFVGGTTEDAQAFRAHLDREGLGRVRLVPHVPHAEVLAYLAAADVLALPNSGQSHERNTTSPIKLWEYLAARRPVVASDLPSLRELVGDAEVRFVVPDDPAALAAGIVAAAGDAARASAGWERVRSMDWASRAKALAEFLEKL